MSSYCGIVLILTIISNISATVSSNVSSITTEQYYNKGVESYLDEKWQDCIDNFENAIHTHKSILNAISDCRVKCQHEKFEPLLKKDVDDIHFYEKMLKKTLCFLKCKRTRYSNVAFDFTNDLTVQKYIEELKPYSYLHICYFQKRLIQKAASASFTYLVGHQNDKTMKKNLEYYLTLPEVDSRDVVNFESEEYIPLYLHGMNSYSNEDWDATIAYVEESLQAYFSADLRCRVLCEGSFDQGWFPDFAASVSNHYTFCLKCKQECNDHLKMLNGLKGKEILADFYNHLQISYFKTGQIAEACRAVASYLLIYPSDEEMIHNKKFYSSSADPEMFSPRPEIVHFLLREEYENKLLNFIDNSFTAEFQLVNDEPHIKLDVKDNEISNDSNDL